MFARDVKQGGCGCDVRPGNCDDDDDSDDVWAAAFDDDGVPTKKSLIMSAIVNWLRPSAEEPVTKRARVSILL